MTTSQRARIACAVLCVLGALAPRGTPVFAQATSEVEAKLEELSRRLVEQERENERQRAELEAYKAQLAQQPAQSSAEEAELAKLLAPEGDAAAEEVAAEEGEPSFRVYGFADAGLQRSWGGFFKRGLTLSDSLNFVLGNVNVYFDAQPLAGIRMLTEVRFTTFPDGAESSALNSGDTERVTTGVFDHTSAAGGIFILKWSAIILERAQLEVNATDWINVRLGYFLTPLGIWNVDHGSPTRIMLRPPLLISSLVVPERQTGLEIHGVFHAKPWDLNYSLYVSNGRLYGAVDFSDDKAVGTRLVLRRRRPIGLALGASLYFGTAQDYVKMPGIVDGQAALVRHQVIGLTELIAAADISLDIDALRIRAEGVLRRVVYEDGKRELAFGVPNADSVQSSGYIMLAYQLPFWKLEPLIMAEFLRQPIIQLGEIVVTGSAGFNIYFNPVLTLRTQYSYSSVLNTQETSRDYSGNDLHIIASRLIIAY